MRTQANANLANNASYRQQALELLLILTTVGFFYLAFPTGGYSHFAWIALLPICLALTRQTPRQAFVSGFLAATLGWIFSIWWVVPSLSAISNSPIAALTPLVLIYCCVSALPYAVACWLHVYFNCGKSIHGALFSALNFTVFVNYTPQILPGNLAHGLYNQPLFIQAADIGGVALVFFIIHSVCFLLANAIAIDSKRSKQKLGCVLLAAIVFLANYSYGYLKIKQSQAIDLASSKQINLAMVQPNITIENRSREDWQQLAPELMTMVRNIIATEPVDLIIVPELPVPVSFQHFSFDKKQLSDATQGTALLLTAIKPIADNLADSQGYFNTMELVLDNRLVQNYAKQVLLPFGEYLPFETSLPWLRKVFPGAANYKPGQSKALFELPLAEHSITLVPLICYEAVFSDTVGQGVALGGELLINTSNDAWFGNTAGQKVHLALSSFRSIEYRKPLVRNTNNGISVIIDPFGQQISSSKITPHSQGYSVTTLTIAPMQSFYQQHPNTLKWIFIVLAILTITTKLVNNKKAGN
ncbi:apolipoprotein N-acyltransferase [Colwellia chukchiensis]|uniref:Apolipoprotein N-acyltransferase n=1 Tax=Colwellia chukchiensis TaxID=641665 RepID=A0A1H7GQJ5_9GAMM|nr:apolipoprotein N-acyltransferase [Colwellia chukchiensis]SEK40319.1 apolipoprotein N-acyltransferase [Colwellia chukchiensis]